MRVVDLAATQKRSGVIRLGEASTGENNIGRPLSTFRLTSNDKKALDAVAVRYGGVVGRWDRGSQLFQIVTKANELPIEISNVDTDTAYELWAQVGDKKMKECLRRCDGCNIVGGKEQGVPCKCPSDPIERSQMSKARGKVACSLTLRMFVRLPEIPDVGLWQVTSGSYFAAKQVPALMEGVGKLAQMGLPVRARLAIDRQRSGGRQFPVLAVRIDQSLDEIKALAVGHFEKLTALEACNDPMTRLAFQLGMPTTVVDGRLIRTVKDDVPALTARPSLEQRYEPSDDIFEAQWREGE
jgi:hypothetical protein